MENIKTKFTPRLTRKEKLERAINKLYLTPGKAVTNYNICNKLMKELNELNRRGSVSGK